MTTNFKVINKKVDKIRMDDLKPGQVAIIDESKGLLKYNGTVVMRTKDKDSLEIMAIDGSDYYWVGACQLLVRPINATITVTIED